MEIIFLALLLIAVLVMQYFMYCKVEYVRNRLENHFPYNERKFDEIHQTISSLNRNVMEFDGLLHAIESQFQRSMLSIAETAKPIKPNNFDSLREAFKGPTRVEINERN